MKNLNLPEGWLPTNPYTYESLLKQSPEQIFSIAKAFGLDTHLATKEIIHSILEHITTLNEIPPGLRRKL